MKNGDLVDLVLLRSDGFRIRVSGILRVDGETLFADVTPDGPEHPLKQRISLDLEPGLMDWDWVKRHHRYRGEIAGAVMVQDAFWSDNPR